MSGSFPIPVCEHDNLLAEAVTRRCPLSVSTKSTDGWSALQSRLLGLDLRARELIIEFPYAQTRCPVDFAGGEYVAVSFRRGPRRFVFNAMVVSPCRHSIGPG